MPIRVVIVPDYEAVSEQAAGQVLDTLRAATAGRGAVLGLATGASPLGLYGRLVQAAARGEFDPRRVQSFNLDEYVGLPGRDPAERAAHPESYASFMDRALFSRLPAPFARASVPAGTAIDHEALVAALAAFPGDWRDLGADAGRRIALCPEPRSPVLARVRHEVLDAYERQIREAGGIDLQVIGVGGRGHVAFHEAGIPFQDSRMLLVRLDEDTVRNAVADGHFPTADACPRYAVTMGCELVFEARKVVLLASGARKTRAIARSLLDDVSPDLPLSYGQHYAARGGDLTYVVDAVAGAEVLAQADRLRRRGVEIEDHCGCRAAAPAPASVTS